MALIPAEKMLAVWDTNDDMKVIKLLVVEIGQETPETKAMHGSAGASDQGWMGDLLDTPFGLFTYIATAYGFVDRKAAGAALNEFAKVEGTKWVGELKSRAGL